MTYQQIENSNNLVQEGIENLILRREFFMEGYEINDCDGLEYDPEECVVTYTTEGMPTRDFRVIPFGLVDAQHSLFHWAWSIQELSDTEIALAEEVKDICSHITPLFEEPTLRVSPEVIISLLGLAVQALGGEGFLNISKTENPFYVIVMDE